jgi:LCP family protein required for cell wall assembly
MSEPPRDPPPYTIYRTRPRLFGRNRELGSPLDELRGDGRPPGPRRRLRLGGRGGLKPGKPWSAGRVVKIVLLAIGAWLLLSFVLFLISAQLEQDKVSDEAEAQLTGGGYPLVSANTILVLGSDARPKNSKEPGAGGPSRSDSIMLMRVGGGHSAKLSILRDTVVPIPGHGLDKINAAYAYGGAALSIKTIKEWLGIDINHVVEINFERFPDLIDSMGGIKYTGGCVVSKINGGSRNGGYTLRLRKGTHHINGKQALALARTRHNLCNAREDDRTRAARQQKIFAAMKSRLTSPGAFIRLPWISWNAPKTLRSDMSGPTLAGLFGGLAIGGAPPTRVMRPSGAVTTASGGAGLTVSETEKRREVQRFLKG